MPTDLTGDLLAGPYGFLVAIAVLLYGAAREYRRGRQVDVSTYQDDIVELTSRLKAKDEAHRVEVAGMTDDLVDVKTDLAQLRDDNATQLRQAALAREDLIRENARLRTLLAESPVTPDQIEGTS